jgi:capsular polysaccharide biosynthesis protein
LQDIRSNGRSYSVPPNAQNGLVMAAEAPQDDVLTGRDPLRVIFRWLWVIVAVAVAVAGATVWYDYQQAPTYKASTKILVGQDASSISAVGNLEAESKGLASAAKMMGGVIKTRPVAEATVERLGLPIGPERLVNNLEVGTADESPFIEISYQDSNPKQAKQIVKAVADVFLEQIAEEVAPPNAGLDIRVWEEATLPNSPVSPNPRRDGILGLALGGIFGIALAFLLERLDDRLRSPEEIEQTSGIPTFSVLPK